MRGVLEGSTHELGSKSNNSEFLFRLLSFLKCLFFTSVKRSQFKMSRKKLRRCPRGVGGWGEDDVSKRNVVDDGHGRPKYPAAIYNAGAAHPAGLPSHMGRHRYGSVL